MLLQLNNIFKWVTTGGQRIFLLKDINLEVPLVVRLEGTKVDEGKAIINDSGLNVIAADDLDDAAQKIVREVKG